MNCVDNDILFFVCFVFINVIGLDINCEKDIVYILVSVMFFLEILQIIFLDLNEYNVFENDFYIFLYIFKG